MSQGYLELADADFWTGLRAATSEKLLEALRGPKVQLEEEAPPAPVEEEEGEEDDDEGPDLPLEVVEDEAEEEPEPAPTEEPPAELETTLILDAPRRVDLSVHQTLPAAALRVGPARELVRLDLGARGFLVSVDQLSGELRWSILGREDAPPPVLKDVDPATLNGAEAEALELEARGKLRLPWRPSKLLLYALVRERVSEACEVELVGDDFHDEAVAAFVAERRKSSSPARVSPFANKRRPRYRPLDESPEVPESPGIAFNVTRVTLLEEQERIQLLGSYRLRLHDLDRVEPGAKVLGLPPGEKPTAIFPITLFVSASQTPTPRVLHLRVPSYDPAPAGVEDLELTGHFELNLQRMKLIPPDQGPETLFVYAFARGVVAGPRPIGLVNQAMIDGDPPELPPEPEGI